ncbi:MAG: hypothetical protein EXX96DRAFT_474217 [Benjaminiella poitrasii]|nr:MAG: hypothetical protein EXX96DRAFT_474217 [Benjaminiella poitrasii]
MSEHETTTTTSSSSSTTTTAATTPITRWFPRIRRRSSSATTSSTLSNNSFYEYNNKYTEDTLMVEDKQIDEFQHLYRLGVDEIAYAIESQGSIYYSGDLISATEAVNNCLDRFQQLMQTLNSERSHKLQQEWTEILFELRSKLDSLPYASSTDGYS